MRLTWFLAWLSLTMVADAAVDYRIRVLDDLGGGFARARAVNVTGAVVGESLIATTGSVEHAFQWTPSLMLDLGTAGGPRSRALDINDTGIIAGWAQTVAGSAQPVLWSASGLTLLSTLGGASGSAWAINDAGVAVGQAYLNASVYHAAQWRDAAITDLGTLGGTYSMAYAVNNAGVVAGTADTGLARQNAATWTDGGIVDLGELSGGTWNTVRGINDAGELILWGTPNGGTANQAAFWSGQIDSPVLNLGTFGGAESWAYGLNNHGYVVGWAELAVGNYHAFVWDGSTKTDLGTLGGLFSAAYAINDAGIIVGYAQDAQGRTHAVSWAIPEPATAVLVLFAAVVLLGRYPSRIRTGP